MFSPTDSFNFAVMWGEAVARAFEATTAALSATAQATTESAVMLCAVATGVGKPAAVNAVVTTGNDRQVTSWYRKPQRNAWDEWQRQVVEPAMRFMGVGGRSLAPFSSAWPWAQGSSWGQFGFPSPWQNLNLFTALSAAAWPSIWPAPWVLARTPIFNPFEAWSGHRGKQLPRMTLTFVAYRSNSGFAVAPILAPEAAAGALALLIAASQVVSQFGSGLTRLA